MSKQNNWYYTVEELENLPSLKDGISKVQEAEYRKATCAFIQEAGRHLKIPQLTIATAMVFMHRFYVLHSFKTYDRLLVAATCIFLACKVEETPKKLSDVIFVTDKLIRAQQTSSSNGGSSNGEPQETKHLTPESAEFNSIRENVLQMERILLQTLAFDLKVEHPYRYVIQYVKSLQGQRDLAQVSWNFANDSLRTTLCLQCEPKLVAAAAVYLGAKFLGTTQLPSNCWDIFEAKLSDIEKISNQVLDLYEGTEQGKKLKSASILTTPTTTTPAASSSAAKFLPFDLETTDKKPNNSNPSSK